MRERPPPRLAVSPLTAGFSDFADGPASLFVECNVAQTLGIPAAVQAVVAGDATRFGDVVRAFDGLVRRIVGRSLSDPHAREDVVQEVWLRVYQRVAALLHVQAIDAWITRVAQNCVLDHHRQRRRAVLLTPLAEATDEATEAAGLSGDADWVWELVDKLPSADGQLLSWRYRDALSYSDIGARLGVPHSTVRGRLFEARQALRRLLESRRTT